MTWGRPKLVSDKPLAQPAQLTRKPHRYVFCKRGIHNLGAGVLSMRNSEAQTEMSLQHGFPPVNRAQAEQGIEGSTALDMQVSRLTSFWRHKPVSVEMVVSEWC